MSFLMKYASGVFSQVGNFYRGALAMRLKEFGLKYDDILVETKEVKEALSRLSPEEIENRNRRLLRAHDISLKRKPLPVELQNYDPFESYLEKHLEKVTLRQQERDILNK
uniref:Cytochrome b-c1 complex subunit 7 n=1 Tax=Fibrocapsa japonica TaxID=94617 RepID=A0A7S2V325_9STRA|mmetsp:Transcript_23825/g.34657  ORF Transcript_23825/g.34657 Transcript_23825/m.34657 type:complete len:110 (+) Transcript_23825:93-422(+)|eukprot:CAMPEP_0113933834 /NCGR_PEP_ID=MMETSP1339-20121228/1153_1 /TAXON_ID=94617 /ORGANISM="Fibrocapsa japonica" /LENGTH=109 /DNA_ID=CAMNT_0000935319 /DNA_START=87 /DNA_END=416 /DNA_ORIENTATION=+ /assembly_acc=CAM_ASM_000762